MKINRILLLVCLVIALAGCGDRQTPTPEPVTPTATSQPTATITPQPTRQMNYALDAGDLDSWTRFYFSNDVKETVMNNAETYVTDGRLWFDIRLLHTYLYLINNTASFANVEISSELQSYARETNYLTLICRYREYGGWYEFNLSSNGYAAFLRYDPASGFHKIGEGVLRDTNTGSLPNQIKMRCEGDAFTLVVNGNLWRIFHDQTYTSGKIGLSVGTEEFQPVRVRVNWFTWTDLGSP